MDKNDYTYKLPDEKQWERAARGTDGRIYPWGNDFYPNRCNTKQSGRKSTTRVDRYADGVSPVGCYDMAGNVWEWIDFDPDNHPKNHYFFKGGSWNDESDDVRCFVYDYNYPNYRNHAFIGFRCIKIKKQPFVAVD